MKRFFVPFLFIILILTACTDPQLLPNKQIEKMVLKKIDTGETFYITSDEEIQVFQKALTDAERLNGIQSISTQDYEITFHFENTDQKPIFMWLSDDSGIAMDPNNEQACFTIKEPHVEAIQSLGLDL